MCFGVAINNRYCFPFPHQFLRHRFGPTLSPSSSLLRLDGKWRSAGRGPKKAVSPAVTLGTRREGGLTLNGIIVRGQVQAEVGIGRGGGGNLANVNASEFSVETLEGWFWSYNNGWRDVSMHSNIISQKLLTDDDAVHRNVSSTVIVRSKSFPPVSLLQTQSTMRVILARSFGSLVNASKRELRNALFSLR